MNSRKEAGQAKLAGILAVLLALSAGVWVYLRYFHKSPDSRKAEVLVKPTSPSTDAATVPLRKIQTPHFDPLGTPATPGFLSEIATTREVKLALYYEGDEHVPRDYMYQAGTSVVNQQNERYLLLPDSIDRANRYGPNEFDIFKNEESHSYQGIPVAILNPSAKYSLEIVGLKINDPRLISRLFVEMGIDYDASEDGDGMESSPSTARKLLQPLSAWLFPVTVHACGPGIYLRPVGRSPLIAAQAENGISWYKLEPPIALYNLPLDYCDKPAENKTRKDKSSEAEQTSKDGQPADDEPTYCRPIEDLSRGHLRLHLAYEPSGIEGILQMQVVNFIFQDERGRHFQPTIAANLTTYYRACLVDHGCLKAARQPVDCVKQ